MHSPRERSASQSRRHSQGRLLRVEFRGQPFDWFNLEDLGELVQSMDFVITLRENISHYFGVPSEWQIMFDDAGVICTSADLLRALQHSRPSLRVYDMREMPINMLDQMERNLAVTAEELASTQHRFYSLKGRPGALSNDIAHPHFANSRLVPPVSYTGVSLNGSRFHTAQQSSPLSLNTPGAWTQPVAVSEIGPIGPSGLALAPLSQPLGQDQAGTTIYAPGLVGASLQSPYVMAAPSPITNHGSFNTAVSVDVRPVVEERFETVEVLLDKEAAGSTRYGFANMPSHDRKSLDVSWIDSNGVLATWNGTHPSLAIREGDKILSVNSICEDVDAMRAQLQGSFVRMLVQRRSTFQC